MENTKCDIIIETTFDVFNAMVKLHFEKDEAKKVRISLICRSILLQNYVQKLINTYIQEHNKLTLNMHVRLNFGHR